MIVFVPILIFAVLALFAVYAWTDLGELIDEQVRLDMWADEVTERDAPSGSSAVRPGTDGNPVLASRSLTSLVSPRSAATDAGGFGDAA